MLHIVYYGGEYRLSPMLSPLTIFDKIIVQLDKNINAATFYTIVQLQNENFNRLYAQNLLNITAFPYGMFSTISQFVCTTSLSLFAFNFNSNICPTLFFFFLI